MACVKCNIGIRSDEVHYIAADLGPELLFIIEQDVAHEVGIYFYTNSFKHVQLQPVISIQLLCECE